MASKDFSVAVPSAMEEERPAPPKGRGEAFRAWAYVLIWIAIIAVESTEMLSAQNTGSILWLVLTTVWGDISPARFQLIHALLRKVGHFAGYSMLSLLLFRAFRASLQRTAKMVWERRWAILALAGTVAVAILDEWHQTHLASRTGSILDVLLDGSGGVLTQLMIVFALNRRAAGSS